MTAALRCAPGDLAWIVHDEVDGVNLGLMVEVVRALPACDCARCARRPRATWECRSTGRDIADTIVVFGLEIRARAQAADIPDAWLRPVKPKSSDDATDEMVKRVGPAPLTLTELLRREEVSHG